MSRAVARPRSLPRVLRIAILREDLRSRVSSLAPSGGIEIADSTRPPQVRWSRPAHTDGVVVVRGDGRIAREGA